MNVAGGKVPKDSVTVRKIMRELSSSLYISMCCMAGMGITLTCVFLAFNIGYRKSKYVYCFNNEHFVNTF